MRFWAIAFRVVGFVWIYLAGFLILTSITGVLMNQGDAGVRELLSPFKPINWLVILLTLLPGLGLLLLSNKLQRGVKTLD